MAKIDSIKTLLYGIFAGCFLAAGALALAFLIEILLGDFLESVDFGLILLLAAGICFIIGFFLDGRHAARQTRRKNILEHQRMLVLKYEQQMARERNVEKKGSDIFRGDYPTQKISEGIDDYAERYSLNKGMLLLVAGFFDFLLLVLMTFWA
ncbi:MAG: hypothetical protein ACFFGZ_05105 [Candidatus Thorarchaeota archaeon]